MSERPFDAADDARDARARRARQDHLQNDRDQERRHRTAAHPPAPLPPMMPAASTTAAVRSQTLSGAAGADAHALSAMVSTSRDAPPAVASASRKSSAPRSSTIDACRRCTVGTSRRRAQPAREQLFAEMRAGAREQLEQRGGTEDIEIAGVQMILARETARRSRRCPATCLRGARCRARKTSRRAQRGRARVCTRSCQTARATNAEMGTASSQAEAAGSEHEPGRQRERGHDRQTRVADAGVEAGEARMCPPRAPPAVRDMSLSAEVVKSQRLALRSYLKVYPTPNFSSGLPSTPTLISKNRPVAIFGADEKVEAAFRIRAAVVPSRTN